VSQLQLHPSSLPISLYFSSFCPLSFSISQPVRELPLVIGTNPQPLNVQLPLTNQTFGIRSVLLINAGTTREALHTPAADAPESHRPLPCFTTTIQLQTLPAHWLPEWHFRGTGLPGDRGPRFTNVLFPPTHNPIQSTPPSSSFMQTPLSRSASGVGFALDV
jgi:hypothetical protein